MSARVSIVRSLGDFAGALTDAVRAEIRSCSASCRSSFIERWVLVVAVDVAADGGDELLQILEDATPNLVCGQVAEESFDHVGHEAEVGVKRTWNCLCFPSQRCTRSCLWVA